MGTETETHATLRLAAEAFHAKNYELAADIYGYQLAEPAESGYRPPRAHGEAGGRARLRGEARRSLRCVPAGGGDRPAATRSPGQPPGVPGGPRGEARGRTAKGGGGGGGRRRGSRGRRLVVSGVSGLPVRAGDPAVRTQPVQEVPEEEGGDGGD